MIFPSGREFILAGGNELGTGVAVVMSRLGSRNGEQII